MSLEVPLDTYRWLTTTLKLFKHQPTLQPNGQCLIPDDTSKQFQNGLKVAQILSEIFKLRNLPPPPALMHLKKSTHTAAQLYNWNILNEVRERVIQSMRKVSFEVDSDTKNMIINGDRGALAAVLEALRGVYQGGERGGGAVDVEDSLDGLKPKESKVLDDARISDIITLQRQPTKPKPQHPQTQSQDLLEYILTTLSTHLKLTRKQAVALIAQNNKYLAHVFVKGVKGSFTQVQQIMQKFYEDSDLIVQKIVENNDMCVFYLQVIKPALLSKNEEVALWASRILTKVGYELANNQLLPIAYEWFVRQSGGLATTMLALTRHPKLSDSAVGYLLQFSRYNISQLFTVQLRKFCPDNLSYLRFILLIFDSLIESKLSAQELLNSGALDYWIEQAEKGADSDYRNSVEMRVVSIEMLVKIWKGYPVHIEETLNLVGNIMNYVKKGIRDESSILRFNFLEELFSLLHHFANQKNPFASILYKKITFLFIQNHQITEFRESVLRNFKQVFRKFQSIPVDIFLQPFIKQLKISQGKSYILNIFDMQFIKSASQHRKLKVKIAIQLFDFLAKTFLNDYVFCRMARGIMEYLLDRFIQDDPFVEYCQKLVKICLAIFYSSLKKRPTKGVGIDEGTRLAMQRRADIVQFLLFVGRKEEVRINEELRVLAVHIRLQIMQNFRFEHKGITEILKLFGDPYEVEKDVMRNHQDFQKIESQSEGGVKFPRIDSRNQSDEMQSQQSFNSKITKTSKNTLSKQEFPIKDYEEFETEEERRFMKQHGLGLKKKGNNPQQGHHSASNHPPQAASSSHSQQKRQPHPTAISHERTGSRQPPNTKVLEQIDRIRQKKQQQVRKKFLQQEKIDRKKQVLKQKIKKQLQQRNIAKGGTQQKNVATKVLFEDGEINEKIVEEGEQMREVDLKGEEVRDESTIAIVLRKYDRFLRKLFEKYSNASRARNKTNTFQEDTARMNQVDLIRMFKQKNIQKNRTTIQQISKLSFDKTTHGIDYDSLLRFLQQYTIHTFCKQRSFCSQPMGTYLKDIIRKLSVGQNIKLQQQDQQTKQLNQKLKQNPQLELPANFKRVNQHVYEVVHKLTYNNGKRLPEAWAICYEIVSEMIQKKFKVSVLEPYVYDKDETRVVKKGGLLPPKPSLKKEISLLNDQPVQEVKKETVRQQPISIRAPERREAKSTEKRPNAAQMKKLEQEEEKRRKQEEEEEHRRQRALEVKRKLEQEKEERTREKQSKKEEEKALKEKELEKQRKQKQAKQQYLKQQKQKISQRKKQLKQQQKQTQQKLQKQQKKNQQVRKQQMKQRMKQQQQKRKQQLQTEKKRKQKQEQEQKQKQLEDEKKKELLKKKAQKSIQQDKEKQKQEKAVKEMLKNLYKDPEIKEIFAEQRDQIKALHAFGMEFNDYKIDQKQKGQLLEQKGWLFIAQTFELCDVATAQTILRAALRDKQEKGLSLETFEQSLLNFSVKGMENSTPGQLKKYAPSLLIRYLNGLQIPKEKARQKQMFVSLKKGEKRGRSKDKKLEQVDLNSLQKVEDMQVVNPQGKKQKWNLKN